MTAQIANGGYKIKPKILTDDNELTSKQIKKAMEDSNLNNLYIPLFDNQKNIKIIQEAMFSSTNELRGTSYKSRIDDPSINLLEKQVLPKLSVLVKESENLI